MYTREIGALLFKPQTKESEEGRMYKRFPNVLPGAKGAIGRLASSTDDKSWVPFIFARVGLTRAEIQRLSNTRSL